MPTILPTDSYDNPIPALRLKLSGAHTVSATTGASARNTTGFNADTRVVSVYAESAVYIAFGDATVSASSSDHYFPAGVYYDIAIGGEQTGHATHVAVRSVDTNGSVYVSEKE